MRYAVFSDIHSNLEAFLAVYNHYEEERIDKFIFLGDIINYGANPNEVLSLLKKLSSISIAGNHDWAAAGKVDMNYFNVYARQALLWTKNQLSSEEVQYLENLPLTYQEDNFICVHGSLDIPHRFNYILDSNDAYLNFGYLRKQICFIGHSHLCEFFKLENNNVKHQRGDMVLIEDKCKYIINVGSVGQPRDGDWRSSICVYDSEKKTVIFRRVEYNLKQAAEKILAAGLPSTLSERLFKGY